MPCRVSVQRGSRYATSLSSSAPFFVTECVTESVTECVTQSVTECVTESMTECVTESVTESIYDGRIAREGRLALPR